VFCLSGMGSENIFGGRVTGRRQIYPRPLPGESRVAKSNGHRVAPEAVLSVTWRIAGTGTR